MSSKADVFGRHQAAIDAVKAAAAKFDAFGNVKRKRNVKLKPLCDDLSTWTSCKDCPVPCDVHETALSGETDE